MKPQLNFRKVITTSIIATLFLSAFTVPVNAQTAPVAAIATEVRPELEVKFLGATAEFLYFELNVSQPDESRSQLRIRNAEGNELYTENLFRKSTTRTMKIAKDEVDKLEFAYYTQKGEVKRTFEVRIRFQEAVEVKAIAKL